MPIFYLDSGSIDNLEISSSLLVSGTFTVSGSLQTSGGGLTGSLFGTASFATTASYYQLVTGSTGTDFNIATSPSGSVLNIPDASATARGLVTTGTQTFAGQKLFAGDFRVGATTGTQYNLRIVGGGNETNNSSYSRFSLAGNNLLQWRIATDTTDSTSLTSGYNYATFILAQIDATESSIGNSNLVTQLAVKSINITNGAGSVDNYATIYIEGASSGTGVPTNNYALWIDSGSVRLDGDLIMSQSNIIVTGSVNASAGFTGSLFGTASYVTGSVFTSANPALSASYALSSSFAVSASWAPGGGGTPGGNPNELQYNNAGTFDGVPVATYDGTTLIVTGSFTGSLTGELIGTASYAIQALSASWAPGGSGASDFPYTGSAIISGSLQVTGSFSTNRDATINALTIGRGTGNVSTNTAIGNSALLSNTNGDKNTAIGYSALKYNNSGVFNVAIGYCAMKNNTSGGKNTAVGGFALYSNISGINNTAIGYTALNFNTSGVSNVAIGCNALLSNTTGNHQVAIGNTALRNSNFYSTSNTANVAVGYGALASNTIGALNTALGSNALQSNNSGCNNTAIGLSALRNNTSGFRNIAIGNSALIANTIGYRNIAIGFCALRSNNSGKFSIAVGDYALAANTTGIQNTAIGYNALRETSTGTRNTGVGNYAMRCNTFGLSNTAVGWSALFYNKTGNNNVAVGYRAGRCIVGSSNLILGGYTGSVDIISSSNNVFISDGQGNLRLFITGSDGLATFFGTGGVSASAFTGSLLGTASWANNAVTASYVTGSAFTSANPALSASYALSSSFSSTAVTASFTLSGGTTFLLSSTGISIADPTAAEDVTLLYTSGSVVIKAVEGVVRGSAVPSVTVTLRYDSDRNATGTAIVSAQAVTSTTTGNNLTLTANTTVPAGNFVWLETTAQSGTVNELFIGLVY